MTWSRALVPVGLLAGCLLGGVSGCTFDGSAQSHTDRATLAACRAHASQVYERNHRADIYSINQTGIPYSGTYLAGNQTNTLAEQYQNDRIVDDCVRNTGTETNREDTAPAAGGQP